jgi:solute carrier family 25, member 38
MRYNDSQISMELDTTIKQRLSDIISVNGLAGGMSGLAACILLQPLDLIKTRLQQQHYQEKQPEYKGSMVEIARKIVNDNGIRGLWRGTIPTLYRIVPGSALYFGMLGMIQSCTQLTTGKGTLSAHENLLIGGISRAMVGTILLPISVVKVRYEVSGDNNSKQKARKASETSYSLS